jgi:hypothetical protein
MGSQYLTRPPRTLREACREMAATNAEFIDGDCERCINSKLCAFYERIEHGLSETSAEGCRRHLSLRLRASLAKKGGS